MWNLVQVTSAAAAQDVWQAALCKKRFFVLPAWGLPETLRISEGPYKKDCRDLGHFQRLFPGCAGGFALDEFYQRGPDEQAALAGFCLDRLLYTEETIYFCVIV